MDIIYRFFKFLVPYRLKVFFGGILILISSSILLPIPFIYQEILDNVFPSGRVDALFFFISLIIFLLVIDQICNVAQMVIFSKIREQVFRDIKTKLYKSFQDMDHYFLVQKHTGGIASNLTNDVDAMQSLLADNFIRMAKDILFILITIVLVMRVNYKLTLLSSVILPFFYLVYQVFSRQLYVLTNQLQQQKETLLAKINEQISGIRYIQSTGTQKHYSSNIKTEIISLENIKTKIDVQNELASSTTVFMSILAIVIIWGFGGWNVINKDMTIGTFFAINTLLMQLYQPISNLLSTNLDLAGSIAAAKRIFAIFDNPHLKERETTGMFHLQNVSGIISFKNVSFRYNENLPLIFDNISICLPARSVICVFGPNGSGKSTLWQLLVGFYKTEKGQICIGEKNINLIPSQFLRNYISVVPQDDFLFNSSIYENILMGREISDKRMNQILELSTVLEMLKILPDGLHTIVGEKGLRLSGGQRQKILIARALVNDPMVLVIDEGLSQADICSETELLNNLKGMARSGKTIILISHKRDTLNIADVLLEINMGKVIKLQSSYESLI